MDVLRPISPPHREPGLVVAFSERGDTAGLPSPTSVLARRFADTLGLPDLPIARATQVHGVHAHLVERRLVAGEVQDMGEVDILVTGQTNLALAVQTADCLPILIAGQGAIAAVHAGWRGSDSRVAEKVASTLESMGVPWPSLRAWVGPSIGPCCYEVGLEVASRFSESAVSKTPDGGFRLDLRAVNRAQLEQAGIAPERISMDPTCTRCGGPRYASYRRDGARAGRMIALIARL
jgi:YfiH family protein